MPGSSGGRRRDDLTVIAHLEAFCGRIDCGWKTDPDGKDMPFQIVRLRAGPLPETVTHATLGLSGFGLCSWGSPKTIRHELVMLSRRGEVPKNIPALLQQVALPAITRKHAYLRGELIGPRGALFEGTELEALYVAAPAYCPEAFATVSTNFGAVVFAWVVPVTQGEADYIGRNGWRAFEDLLMETDPDLLDIHRPSVVARPH